jgi:hypothetical protein
VLPFRGQGCPDSRARASRAHCELDGDREWILIRWTAVSGDDDAGSDSADEFPPGAMAATAGYNDQQTHVCDAATGARAFTRFKCQGLAAAVKMLATRVLAHTKFPRTPPKCTGQCCGSDTSLNYFFGQNEGIVEDCSVSARRDSSPICLLSGTVIGKGAQSSGFFLSQPTGTHDQVPPPTWKKINISCLAGTSSPCP